MHHQNIQNISINQVRSFLFLIENVFINRLISATDHAPFVRSFDENNGRVVFNYCPETCGYVSFSNREENQDFEMITNSSFDRESVEIEKVVGLQR